MDHKKNLKDSSYGDRECHTVSLQSAQSLLRYCQAGPKQRVDQPTLFHPALNHAASMAETVVDLIDGGVRKETRWAKRNGCAVMCDRGEILGEQRMRCRDKRGTQIDREKKKMGSEEIADRGSTVGVRGSRSKRTEALVALPLSFHGEPGKQIIAALLFPRGLGLGEGGGCCRPYSSSSPPPLG